MLNLKDLITVFYFYNVKLIVCCKPYLMYQKLRNGQINTQVFVFNTFVHKASL